MKPYKPLTDTFLDKFQDYLIRNRKPKRYRNDVVNRCDKSKHKNILEDIINEPDLTKQHQYCDRLKDEVDDDCSKGIIGKKTADNYKTAINKLKEFLETNPKSKKTPVSSPIIIRTPTVSPAAEIEIDTEEEVEPVLSQSLLGEDEENDHVYYENDIPKNKRVPGLCRHIEEIYPDIIEKAKDILGDAVDIDFDKDKIPVVLSKKCPTKKWRKKDSYILKQIRDYLNEYGSNATMEGLEIIKNNRYFIDRIVGRFVHEGDTVAIVIYYLNFSAHSIEEFSAQIENTLAHEYMHYLQYKYCKYTDCFNGDTETNVSEAMADFFGLLYSSHYVGAEREKGIRDRYNLWVKRSDSGWPYAEALNFFTVGKKRMGLSTKYRDYKAHGSTDKLKRVFSSSTNAYIAYGILHEDD